MATNPPHTRGWSSSDRRQQQEAAGSRRRPLSDDLIRAILRHFPHLSPADLGGLLVERTPSLYANAVFELAVYDATGGLVLQGRQFNTGIPSFWRPQLVYTRFTELHAPGEEPGEAPQHSDLYEQIRARHARERQ